MTTPDRLSEAAMLTKERRDELVVGLLSLVTVVEGPDREPLFLAKEFDKVAPVVDALAALTTALAEAEGKVERVRALHEDEATAKSDEKYAPLEWCNICDTGWPCPTVAALDGEGA